MKNLENRIVVRFGSEGLGQDIEFVYGSKYELLIDGITNVCREAMRRVVDQYNIDKSKEEIIVYFYTDKEVYIFEDTFVRWKCPMFNAMKYISELRFVKKEKL